MGNQHNQDTLADEQVHEEATQLDVWLEVHRPSAVRVSLCVRFQLKTWDDDDTTQVPTECHGKMANAYVEDTIVATQESPEVSLEPRAEKCEETLVVETRFIVLEQSVCVCVCVFVCLCGVCVCHGEYGDHDAGIPASFSGASCREV